MRLLAMKCHPLISHRPIPKVTCMKNRPLRNSACRNGFGPAWLIEWLLSTRWCKLWCQHLWPPNRRICASCFWIIIPTTKIGIQLAMIKKKMVFQRMYARVVVGDVMRTRIGISVAVSPVTQYSILQSSHSARWCQPRPWLPPQTPITLQSFGAEELYPLVIKHGWKCQINEVLNEKIMNSGCQFPRLIAGICKTETTLRRILDHIDYHWINW